MNKVGNGFSFTIIILIVLSPEFVLYTEAIATQEWTTNVWNDCGIYIFNTFIS